MRDYVVSLTFVALLLFGYSALVMVKGRSHMMRKAASVSVPASFQSQ